jgi:hypothetical protein
MCPVNVSALSALSATVADRRLNGRATGASTSLAPLAADVPRPVV